MRQSCFNYAERMSRGQRGVIDRTLIDATAAAISRWGLEQVTLERVAEEAGLSRATIYRRGVTREDLVAALTIEAADTYRRAILPAIAGSGTACEPLRAAFEALCDTADDHLHLLAGLFLARGELFHQPGPDALVVDVFAEPFERLLRDGASDGSLRATSPEVTATVLFNLVGWGYIHLRAAHDWKPGPTREAVIDVVMAGIQAPADPAEPA
jgi:AcrR family transcriptional regulator